MKQLYKHFPRELGFPRRKFVVNKKEFYNLINIYNGKKTVFFSVYDCDKFRNYDNCKLDKIFIDVDGKNAYRDTIRLHSYCLEYNIKHIMLFSGRKGFHVYISTDEAETKYGKRDVLYNVHKHLENILGITIDEKIIGDIARLGRFPNTKHLLGKCYCIPISSDDLAKGLDFIKEKAKKQNFRYNFYGTEHIKLSEFDKISSRPRVIMENHAYEFKGKFDEDKIVKKFLPCVKLWLTNPNKCKNESRYYFAKYCIDMGIPTNVINNIAKKYWLDFPETGGRRSKYDEFNQEKQIYYASKSDRFVPMCETLYSKGFCLGKCKHYKKVGFPIYR